MLNYQYDALGRLASITDGSGSLIVSYPYDTNGRLSRKDMGNGTYTTYTYDADSRILDLINYAPDGTILSRFDYTYDSRGRITSMNTLQGTWTYTYDDLGQLTGWTAPDGSSATYTYDAMGNRIQVTQNGATTSYTTNNLNQYTTVGGVTYTYDADGNLIRKASGSDVTTYSYDPENRLIAVTHGSDSQTYTYDALGNRVASTDNGVVTHDMIDPIGLGNLVGQYDGSGNLVARYDYGFGLVSQIDASGNSYFYNFSAIGNTSELTNATGSGGQLLRLRSVRRLAGEDRDGCESVPVRRRVRRNQREQWLVLHDEQSLMTQTIGSFIERGSSRTCREVYNLYRVRAQQSHDICIDPLGTSHRLSTRRSG